jgi:hypothetical protein
MATVDDDFNSSEKPTPPQLDAPLQDESGYVDGILRNREWYFEQIFSGPGIWGHIAKLLLILVLLTGLHGLFMGASAGGMQILSSGLKLPVLYLLSTAICFPVLYVINVIMGSKLSCPRTLALILLSLALNAILLASCAPIVLFFALTGATYDFLKLLEVTLLFFCGTFAMVGLWRGLEAMCEKSALYPKQAVRILAVWSIVFGIVGTQMAWSLRPFVGTPGMEFEWFRNFEHGNFYESVFDSIGGLLRNLD